MSKQTVAQQRSQRFKANLRALMKARGLSQATFAEKAGINRNWVRKACQDGVGRIHDDNKKHLKRVCRFFGIEIEKAKLLWAKKLNPNRLPLREKLSEQEDWFVSNLRWLLRKFPDDPVVEKVKRTITNAASSLANRSESSGGSAKFASDSDADPIDLWERAGGELANDPQPTSQQPGESMPKADTGEVIQELGHGPTETTQLRSLSEIMEKFRPKDDGDGRRRRGSGSSIIDQPNFHTPMNRELKGKSSEAAVSVDFEKVDTLIDADERTDGRQISQSSVLSADEQAAKERRSQDIKEFIQRLPSSLRDRFTEDDFEQFVGKVWGELDEDTLRKRFLRQERRWLKADIRQVQQQSKKKNRRKHP